MMMNKTVSAVCGLLDSRFSLPVYTEPQVQGMKNPCFFVTAEDYFQKRFLGSRRQEGFTVQILYLPASAERRREDCLHMGNELSQMFDLLPVQGELFVCMQKKYDFTKLTRGFNRGFEIDDQVLKFTFSIRYFTRTPGEESGGKMQSHTLQVTERS